VEWVETSDPPNINELANEADRAIARVAGCPQGQLNCPAGSDAQNFYALVTADLRAHGLCAGQHETGHTDEIAVAWDCAGPWLGMHVYNYGGQAVIWYPSSRRPSWRLVDAGICTGTSPSPTGCPLLATDIAYWDYWLSPHGQNQQLDITPIACGEHVSERILAAGGTCSGMVKCCPMAVEKGPPNAACQALLYGNPVWRTVSGNPSYFPISGPFTIKVTAGEGEITAPGSAGAACPYRWRVSGTIPACTTDEAGHCIHTDLGAMRSIPPGSR
jgi:hypothetical protein